MELQQKVSTGYSNGLSFAKKENALMQAEFESRQVVELLPAAIYTCDAQGRITFYNEAAAALWGRRPVIGEDFWCGSWKIFYPDGTPMGLDECPMAITLKEGRAVEGAEIVVERPDGVRRVIQPHPKPIFDSDGVMAGAVNMLVDITDKKEAEQAIRQSEKKYRLLADSLEKKVKERTLNLKKSEERYHKMVEEVQDYAILLLDKDGTIMNWNKGAEKIKGYKEEEIIGKNFRIFYSEEDRTNKLPEKLIKEAEEKDKAMHEGWRIRKNGKSFWGSVVITALHDDEKNVIGFSKVTRDLTERKLANDKLEQYNAELEFKNKELEQYAYVASHDLQEPLRKIQTFAEVVEKNIDEKEFAKKYLDKINSSAKRLTNLIKDVLNYSSLSKADEIFVETDLNQVLKNVEEDFELLIEQKQAIIRQSELPVIKCIPMQIQQLFSNLLSNAIKFNNQNPVIDITSKKVLNGEIKKYPNLNVNRSYEKITFTDNGIGFEPQYAEQVFKLFQRLSGPQLGTGIGLAICKKIVENHGGNISVLSVPDKGTTFTIFLPVS